MKRIENIYPVSLDLLSVEEARELPEKVREYAGWWWLRNSSTAIDDATCVSSSGASIIDGCNTYYQGCCCRPALTVSNLEYSNLKLYENYSLFGKTWIYIGDDRFLYNDELIEHRIDPKSNKYEKSEIKQFLDWFLIYLQKIAKTNKLLDERNNITKESKLTKEYKFTFETTDEKLAKEIEDYLKEKMR